MTVDPRLDYVLHAIHQPGPVDDEPDYEAEWEMRHDPETDLDRAEDAYEAWLDTKASQ